MGYQRIKYVHKENMLTPNANERKIKNNICHVINIRLR